MINAFGISFHYFHNNNKHIVCQGSLDKLQFDRLIQKILCEYDVVSPDTYFNVIDSRKMFDRPKVVLTFSCGLKSQYDIALPILNKYGIKAIWFLYTDNYCGNDISVEKYHHFRFYSYKSVDMFYNDFFALAKNCTSKKEWDDFALVDELEWSDYYTEQDKRFKYLRNKVLSNQCFDDIMFELMRAKGYSFDKHKSDVWFSAEVVKELVDRGHMLGLHTHSHPNDLKSLSYEEQKKEYSKNKKCLESISGKEVRIMSHPCNSYNEDTLTVLRELGIKYGFRSDMSKKNYTLYELPQIDASSLWKQFFM